MRPILCAVLTVLPLLVATLPAAAQDAPLPERFITTQRGVDFPGGDLVPLFNTTLGACQAACLAQDDCAGFTFNARNGACFPKHTIRISEVYEGAVSGLVRVTGRDALQAAGEARDRAGFLTQSDIAAAWDYAQGLALEHSAGQDSTDTLLARARAARQSGAGADALALAAAAVTVAQGAPAWLEYAQALAAERAPRFDLQAQLTQRARAAAVNAWLRATDNDTRIGALAVLAEVLERDGRGRDALAALRLADTIAPGSVGEALDRLEEMFGFRMTDHRVESDAAVPRICAVFSEDLAPGLDPAPFVQITGTGHAVEAEGPELCITGLSHGSRYALTLRAGLPAATGEVLRRPAELALYVRDRAPMVRFPGRGYVLPANGPRALPVETVNSDTLDLTLWRVSDRNLAGTIRDTMFGEAMSHWRIEDFADRFAEPVWTGTADVAQELNQTLTARLPLDDVGAMTPGAYVLRAAVPGLDPWEHPPATQWFMVSDLGLSTLSGTDGLHVVVQGLSDAQPVEGAEVALVARSNRILGTAVTDARGHALFAAALTRGTGAAAPALVQVERGGDDMAVLSLAGPEFDLTDRGVAGRVAPGPVDVFLTTERGAYRAGETIHATALARDGDARAVAGLPLTARLSRPDGVEYARSMARAEVEGGHVFEFPLGRGVPRGVWRLDILADPDAPALAGTTLLVEDFLPERIDFDLTLAGLADGAPVDLDAAPELSLSARYLFGAPAAGLALEGSASLRGTDRLEGWEGWRFGRHDLDTDTQRAFFAAGLQTDADGELRSALPLDGLQALDRPMLLDLAVALRDTSGRPVERRLTRAVRPQGPVLGIRPAFDGVLPEGAEAAFDLVALDPDGGMLPTEIIWRLERVETRFQWFNMYGSWNWEPVTTRRRVAEGRVRVDGTPVRIAEPVDWGTHELRIETADGPHATTSVPFTAGWYAAASTRDTPDMLEIGLDRAAYAPGDTARLRLVPRSEGMALVSVLSDRVVDMQLVEVGPEETVLDLPVTDDWGAGVYVSATLLRPGAGASGHLPARALGLAHAAVDPADRALTLTLDAPSEATPRGPLTVTLDAGDAEGTVWATVAAVDLGILNLTRFDPPDPSAHYFGQRQLGVALRDIYGRLIDASQGAMGQVRSGGDAARIDRSAPPPTEELVAYFSGPVELVDGQAEVSFDLPAFNGTVRVMAVAWSDRGVGQAHADVVVADPVVAQITAPRFLAPGDRARLLLELTHANGPAGEMALSVTGHGLGAAPDSVMLTEGGRAVLELALAPTEQGTHDITVALTLPDGQELVQTYALQVERNDPVIARATQFVLDPGQVFTFDDAALDGLMPGTARATLVAGAGAALDLPGMMLRLGGYPYGCTEQVVSGALPLLVAGDIAGQLGLGDGAARVERIARAIDAVLTNQSAEGSFGLWSPGWGDLWLNAYVTDFLWRARAEGHAVPQTALRMALDNLRNSVNYAGELQGQSGAPYAYAMLVLARAGEAAVGDLRYYADTRAEAFDTPLAAAQLGAALAAYGDPRRADALFAQAAVLMRGESPTGWRDDYGTALRDAAGVLALAAEAGSEVIDRDALGARLAALMPAPDQLSPQEAVWLLQAAEAMAQTGTAALELDGAPAVGRVIALWEGQARAVRNAGSAPVTLTLTAFGQPEAREPAAAQGFTLSRRYFTLEGAPVDPSQVDLGARMVTVLEVTPHERHAGRLMVDDPLPAGFEIDNPNLLRAGDVGALDWLDLSAVAEMTEARAERFLAAVNWRGEERTLRLGYIVRAVTPGEFHHPAASVEDMYRPERRGRTEPGRVTITP